MNNKHLLYERIVEISDNIEVMTQDEKLHLEKCKMCSKRLEAASIMGEAIRKSADVDQLIDLNHVDDLADSVFDMFSKERNNTGSFHRKLIPAIIAAAAVLIAVFSFSVIPEDPQKNDRTAMDEKKEERKNDPVEKEQKEEFVSSVLEIAQGSVIKGEKYNIVAKKESLLVHENDNYFSVKKGVVEFKVQTGTDFMVNISNIALVRVLGTVFTVKVEKNVISVGVTEGLVEVIDLERGVSRSVAAGKTEMITKMKRNLAKKGGNVQETDIASVDKPVISPENSVFGIKPKFALPDSDDPEMVRALINDLETTLKFSDNPVVQLHELFELYRKTGRWGSIISSWNKRSEQINSQGNPFLREMHFGACEASINLYLYDNKVCRKYRELYPEGPDPDRMEDHLKMAW